MENDKKINWKQFGLRCLVFFLLCCLIFGIFFCIGSCMIAKAQAVPPDLSTTLPGTALFWIPVSSLTNYYIEGSEVWFDSPGMQYTGSILFLYNGSVLTYAPSQDTSNGLGQFYFCDELGIYPTYIGFNIPVMSSQDASDLIDSSSSTYSSNYLYNEGYYAGLAEGGTGSYADGYSAGQSAGYTAGYNMGVQVGDSSSYSSGFADGVDSVNTAEFYAQGFAAGQTAQASSDHVGIRYIWAIASVPISTLASILNWDLLGINLFSLVTGVFTLLIVFWVVKKVI